MASRSFVPPVSTPPTSAYAAWIAICVIWGTTYLAIRIALETIPPGLLGGIRFTVAGLVLCAFVRLRGQRLPPRVDWPIQALVGVLMLGIGNGFVVVAEQWIPSGIAAVGVASAPFWMTGIEALAGGERLDREHAGRVHHRLRRDRRPDLARPVSRRRRRSHVHPRHCPRAAGVLRLVNRIVTVETAHSARQCPGGFGGAAALWRTRDPRRWRRPQESGRPLSFSGRSLAAEVYLIVFGSLGAYSAYVYALQHLSVATVSLYAYINPIIAVILGVTDRQ